MASCGCRAAASWNVLVDAGAVVAEAAAFSKEAVRRLRKVSVSVCRMYGRVVMTNPFPFF